MLVKQIVNLKKVVVDSDLKVSLTLEFIAADRAGKEQVFSINPGCRVLKQVRTLTMQLCL